MINTTLANKIAAHRYILIRNTVASALRGRKPLEGDNLDKLDIDNVLTDYERYLYGVSDALDITIDELESDLNDLYIGSHDTNHLLMFNSLDTLKLWVKSNKPQHLSSSY